jgi:hypothetical protein
MATVDHIFSLFNAFGSLKFLFKGTTNVECIVAPLMLNATFLV